MATITVHQSTPGDDFEAIVTQQALIVAKLNALLDKLDDDPDITATDFASDIGKLDTIVLGY